MTDQEAIDRMMSCASAYHCKREEACFVVATRFKELLARSRTETVQEPDPDVVADYAPHWEANRPDWSAACTELTEAERLAEAHWDYIDGIMIAHQQQDNVRNVCRYHYVTAFVHGYKHALEAVEESRRVFTEHGGLGGK